jgi:hypothetical protein
VIAVFWQPLGGFLTWRGAGEPIALTQGVSLWPSISIRILAIFASLYLIRRALRNLDKNWNEIVKETINLDKNIINKKTERIGIIHNNNSCPA